MKRINIIGTIFGTTGYDNHTRQLANAMYNEGIDCTLTVNTPKNWERAVNDAELDMIKKDARECDTNLAITLPQHWPLYMCDDKDFIGFCVWEGDKVPEYWLDILNDQRVKQIWVPSIHTKEAILNTLYKDTEFQKNTKIGFHPNIIDKIRIVPHGVDSKLFYPQDKTEDHKQPFTFLSNKGFTSLNDRGGIQYLIKAYLEEFTSKDDVDMLIKLNPAYGVPNLDDIIKQLDIQNKDLPKFKVSKDMMHYKDLVNLYNMGDVFVSPTRAEAFHLGCIEALACGLPVITSNYGGQTDFVNDKNGWLIDGKLEEVDFDSMYEGISWLSPNIDELRKTMRDVYNNGVTNEMRTAAMETAKEFSWSNSAKKAHKFLKEIK